LQGLFHFWVWFLLLCLGSNYSFDELGELKDHLDIENNQFHDVVGFEYHRNINFYDYCVYWEIGFVGDEPDVLDPGFSGVYLVFFEEAYVDQELDLITEKEIVRYFELSVPAVYDIPGIDAKYLCDWAMVCHISFLTWFCWVVVGVIWPKASMRRIVGKLFAKRKGAK
jgi:hypothetical protein